MIDNATEVGTVGHYTIHRADDEAVLRVLGRRAAFWFFTRSDGQPSALYVLPTPGGMRVEIMPDLNDHDLLDAAVHAADAAEIIEQDAAEYDGDQIVRQGRRHVLVRDKDGNLRVLSGKGRSNRLRVIDGRVVARTLAGRDAVADAEMFNDTLIELSDA